MGGAMCIAIATFGICALCWGIKLGRCLSARNSRCFNTSLTDSNDSVSFRLASLTSGLLSSCSLNFMKFLSKSFIKMADNTKESVTAPEVTEKAPATEEKISETPSEKKKKDKSPEKKVVEEETIEDDDEEEEEETTKETAEKEKEEEEEDEEEATPKENGTPETNGHTEDKATGDLEPEKRPAEEATESSPVKKVKVDEKEAAATETPKETTA